MKFAALIFLMAFVAPPSFSEENIDGVIDGVIDADVRALYAKALLLFSSGEQASITKAKDIALGVRSGQLLAEGVLRVVLNERKSLLQCADSLPKEEVRRLLIRLLSDYNYWNAISGGAEDTDGKYKADEAFCTIYEGITGKKITENDYSREKPREALKVKLQGMVLSWEEKADHPVRTDSP